MKKNKIKISCKKKKVEHLKTKKKKEHFIDPYYCNNKLLQLIQLIRHAFRLLHFKQPICTKIK